MFNSLSNDDSKRSEPMTDYEFIYQYDFTESGRDFDEVWDIDYINLLRDRAIEDVCSNIRHLATTLSFPRNDSRPKDLYNEHQTLTPFVNKLRKVPMNIFNEAMDMVLEEIANPDKRFLYENNIELEISICKELQSNREGFDILQYLIPAYDIFFNKFRPYWEDAISELKRKHSIINRRKYLIERIDEFQEILTSQGITEYTDQLLEYRQFNLDQIDILTNNNSKN